MMFHLVDLLQIEGQSSEDTDPEADPVPNQTTPLCVTIPYFRRRIISELMEELDTAIDQLHVDLARRTGKQIIPKFHCSRRRTNNISDRTVKHSLPRSLYHRRFLKRLTPSALAIIKPREGPDLWVNELESDSMEED
jgi:hypothetical protein